MMAEQICFELGDSWGTKKSSPAAPQSKDSIAHMHPNGIESWDWQNGGTREPMHPPQHWDISDQVFIKVEPRDWLGQQIPDDDDNNEVVDETLKEAVANLGEEIQGLKVEVAEYNARLNNVTEAFKINAQILSEMVTKLEDIQKKQDRRYVTNLGFSTIVTAPE
jgi:hypothetical protein